MKSDDTPNTGGPLADLKKYTDLPEMFNDYEIEANKAVKMIVCNFSALNMAIEMGFSEQNGGP